MPNLSIKNVPESVVEKLRERARRNHRSMQGELMTLVTEAAEPQADRHLPAHPSPGREHGTRTAEEIWELIRAEHAEPVADVPRAVDIIRADRDGR